MEITNQASWWTANKDLFYCYGCGRGGDVIRFAELYHQVKFPQAVAWLRQWRGVEPLLQEAARFYRIQLHRHSEAVAYLHQRGIRSQALIEHMRIGYAPGGCLRGWLTQLGHSLPALRQAGLVTGVGYDAYVHRIVFPLEGNLYGRSLSLAAPPHRFLPGSKGGLYAWKQAQSHPEVILVEGLFDYAALWEAGFHNVTCSLGTHLNARQFRQLCDGPRTVYLAFDADGNGSGQQAAQCLSRSLRERGITARRGLTPRGPRSQQLLRQRWQRCMSFTACWRRLACEIPGSSTARPGKRPEPVSRDVQANGREVDWVNRFLDQQRIRSVAETTLRSYAYDLLHFLRWWVGVNHTTAITEKTLTESALLDYIRFQTNQQPQPAAASINRRVGIAERALRLAFPHAQTPFVPGFQYGYWRPLPLGTGRPRPALSRLRVRTPKRVIVPLSVDEVAHFWASFRTSRDLAIVGLMLLDGLRSCEVLALNRDDLLLSESQMRVRGKGNKPRCLPLAPETIQLLDHYLLLERPSNCGSPLFVGPQRARSRKTHDSRRTAFPVPPSPSHHQRAQGQPTPISSYLCPRHAVQRPQLAGVDATHGS